MQNHIPKVSIGLAVYNGEKYLEAAVDSILVQTFTDFELIISDNASTDRTAEICRDYAARDKRVRYHRNPTNIGGANNENLTCSLALGEYFRWAADDDICAPTLLEKCVSALENDPSAVLSYTAITKIDANGSRLEILDREIGASTTAHERFWELSKWDHDCETTYGLMRKDALLSTGLQRNYTDSDRTLLCHLSLLGEFHFIPEPLFFKRVHSDMSTQVFTDWRERMVWFDNANQDRITLPYWLQFLHYLEVIGDVPLPIGERLRCYLMMGRWLLGEKRWGRMANDLVLAGKKKFISGRKQIVLR